MAGLIRADDVTAVKERSSIEDVVREHVTLRAAGPGSLKGLCPFHEEKSPSFNVRPVVGAWHCFGCGEGGDVIIDEGAHHQHLDELLKAAWALGDWDGGRITVISTHNGKDNPFNTLCEEIRAKKRRGSLHRVTIHDALAMGLFRRRCEVRDQPYTRQAEEAWLADTLASWGAEEEYLVIPSSSGGVYIRSDLIEECSIGGRIVRLELPDAHMHLPEGERAAIIAAWCEAELGPLLRMLPAARTTLGYDFARSGQGDLSVMAPMFEQQDMVKVCPWLVELRGVPYREQWTIFEFVAGRLGKWFAGAAIDAGARGATHLFNAMAPLRHRDPGPVLALWEDPRVHLELIMDGVHVRPELVAFVMATEPHRVVLVTDAMAAAAAADGDYVLGELPVEVRDRVARIAGTDTIAGSTLTLDRAVRNCVAAGVPLAQAVRAATSVPADYLGLGDVGRLAAGKRADLAVLADDLTVMRVMHRGAWLQDA